MGQTSSKDLSNLQKQLTNVFKRMESTKFNCKMTYEMVPQDLKKYFKSDYDQFEAAKTVLDTFLSTPQKIRSPKMLELIKNIKSVFLAYEKSFSYYIKNMTLALIIVPILTESAKQYFKALQTTLDRFDKVLSAAQVNTQDLTNMATENLQIQEAYVNTIPKIENLTLEIENKPIVLAQEIQQSNQDRLATWSSAVSRESPKSSLKKSVGFVDKKIET